MPYPFPETDPPTEIELLREQLEILQESLEGHKRRHLEMAEELRAVTARPLRCHHIDAVEHLRSAVHQHADDGRQEAHRRSRDWAPDVWAAVDELVGRYRRNYASMGMGR